MNPLVTMVEEAAQVIDFKPVISGGRRASLRTESEHVCRGCGHRRSRFIIRGTIKADRSHTLCFECYRRLVNKARALRAGAVHAVRVLPSAVTGPARTRGDRAQMYADLATSRRHAQIAARHVVEGFVTATADAPPSALPAVAVQKAS